MSKIQFNWTFAKNFRSIDNMGMRIDYENGSTLVGSLDNGAGKSTMLVHALYYLLFDKPYAEGTSKSQLINSRSGKECVVEGELQANGSLWYIKRGMKPTVFEIHKDGVPIIDEAALADHQKNIHKILGMDEKVFCNTVALGLDKFVPFVSMSAGERRNYGEQMLDLLVISGMNEANKADIKALTLENNANNAKQSTIDMQIVNLNRVIELQKQHAREAADGVDADIEHEKNGVAKLEPEFRKLEADIEINAAKKNELVILERDLQNLLTMKVKTQEAIDDVEMLLIKGFLSSNCSSCGQRMPEDDCEAKKKVAEEKMSKLKMGMALLQGKIGAHAEYASRIAELTKTIYDDEQKRSGIRAIMAASLERLKTLTAKKKAAEQKQDWLQDEATLQALGIELQALKEESARLATRIRSHEVMAAVLRDDGAKAQIVEMYLPYLNERINLYMTRMNLLINVTLTNVFDLELQAPDRKGQDVRCLSNGQQTRVNLAILFAWRDVAIAAASCDANILILDEILERMSEHGVADFVEMFKMMDEGRTSLYVISQRVGEFTPLFDKQLMYKLVDDHTVIHTEE